MCASLLRACLIENIQFVNARVYFSELSTYIYLENRPGKQEERAHMVLECVYCLR